MRDALVEWVSTYPTAPIHRDPNFENSPAAQVVSETVPNAVSVVLGDRADKFVVKGSAGQSTWTLTPWVAVMHRSETLSVQDGVYVVYLLSHGCERLHLAVGQGCTDLKASVGKTKAAAELERRASAMRARGKSKVARLTATSIDLNTRGWRAELYEAGTVFAVQYDTRKLPGEDVLLDDLNEALSIYQQILKEGRWTGEDELLDAAQSEAGTKTLEQSKRYAYHRRIERNSSHSKAVIAKQGHVCKGCDTDLSDVYGPIANGLIDAHHLRPLSSLEDGESVSFDPVTDFAVLCPNCHRVAHRLDDVGDIEALRRMVKAQR